MDNKKKIIGVLLISLGFLILFSMIYFNPADPFPAQVNEVQHEMGLVGFWVSYYLIMKTLGLAAIIFPMLLLAWGVNTIKEDKFEKLGRYSIYLLLVAFYFSVGIAIFKLQKNVPHEQLLAACTNHRWGMIGGMTNFLLYKYFGEIGSYIIFFTVVCITALAIIDRDISHIFAPITRIFSKIRSFFSSRLSTSNASEKRSRKIIVEKTIPAVNEDKEKEQIRFEKRPPEPPLERRREAEKTEQEVDETYDEEIEKPKVLPLQKDDFDKREDREYVFPYASLLDELPEKENEVSWDEFMVSAKTLEEKLNDFGIQGKVVEINPGPVITRYEIEPAPGVKVNRFTSLADDLALVMRAKRIRVVAPIPGKAAIGIEIPNRKPTVVYLREIVESPQFKQSNAILPLALGKTIAGDIFIADLVSLPHLLVAGATGSGKSVCLHSIIISLLMKTHPTQMQIVLIDPKRLELTPYNALKNHHLLYRDDLNEQVVTTASNAVVVLRSLEREMERRYELLARAGVRNIEDYNTWIKKEWGSTGKSEEFEKLPYIVLIIDELADLMLTAAREVEEPIARLTQMSRAVGIHLIVATQRPSVDVITGVIKANFPARMAFQVATKTDSRTILDMNGAEKLLGKGDMLFLPPGTPEPIRIHNAFISHEEVKRVIAHIKQQPPPEQKTRMITDEEYNLMNGDNRRVDDERDELFDEALKLVVRHQQGSSSLLQRRLKIGYTRAARIIDQLEQAGFVGPYDGSKAREVLIDEEGLKEYGIA